MQRYIEIRIPSINQVEVEVEVKSKGYNLKQLQSRTVAKAGQEQEQDRSKSNGPFLGLAQSRMIPRNICRANTRHLNPSNIIPISPAHGTDIIDD